MISIISRVVLIMIFCVVDVGDDFDMVNVSELIMEIFDNFVKKEKFGLFVW